MSKSIKFVLCLIFLTSGRCLLAYASNLPIKDMVWVKGGDFIMGASRDKDALSHEKPAHRVRVDGFWIDITPVTNAQFKKFIDQTGYVTTAERAPMVADISPQGSHDSMPNDLQAGSLVFSKPLTRARSWHDWWNWVPGAYWRCPLGPGSSIEGKENHPVVHVSWDDAQAFARWAKKRLPTEAEWEYAAHGGNETKYVWGNKHFNEKMPQCNIWQGDFPYKSSKQHGYFGTTDVKKYKPNAYGLYDMAGNVWQWCADYYNQEHYGEEAKKKISINPQGAATSYDSLEPNRAKRVMKGGSFLCNKTYCMGYRITARMRTSPDTSMNHLGFRCVVSENSKSRVKS